MVLLSKWYTHTFIYVGDLQLFLILFYIFLFIVGFPNWSNTDSLSEIHIHSLLLKEGL